MANISKLTAQDIASLKAYNEKIEAIPEAERSQDLKDVYEARQLLIKHHKYDTDVYKITDSNKPPASTPEELHALGQRLINVLRGCMLGAEPKNFRNTSLGHDIYHGEYSEMGKRTIKIEDSANAPIIKHLKQILGCCIIGHGTPRDIPAPQDFEESYQALQAGAKSGALQKYLDQFNPTLTAPELLWTFQLLHYYVMLEIDDNCQTSETAKLAELTLKACFFIDIGDSMCEIIPQKPAGYFIAGRGRTLLGKHSEAAKRYRAGIQKADEIGDRYYGAVCRCMLISCVCLGGKGSQFPYKTIQDLKQQADRLYKELKPFYSTAEREDLVQLEHMVDTWFDKVSRDAKPYTTLYANPDSQIMDRDEVLEECKDVYLKFKCSCCGRRPIKLKICSACKQAQYCSRECQQNHWKIHKIECKKVQKEREAAKGGEGGGKKKKSGK